jgi:hypothetical protein
MAAKGSDDNAQKTCCQKNYRQYELVEDSS